MRHMGDQTHQRGALKAGGGGIHTAPLASISVGSGSNSMGEAPLTIPGASTHRPRYDDDDEAEVGCMGATGGNQDAAAAITRRRRMIFAFGAIAIVAVFLLAAGAAVMMEEQGGDGGSLGYVPRDALLLPRGECNPADLFKMATKNGVDASRVRLAEFDCALCEGGKRRGLAASGSIPEGDVIISTAWTGVLSAEHSMEELAQAVALFPEMNSKEKLALKFLYHRFLPDSPLKPYMCTLPKAVGNPIEWEDAKVDERFAKLSDMAVRVKSSRLFLVQQYNKYLPLLFSRFPALFSPVVHTPQAWIWAMQTIRARNWQVNRKREPIVTTAVVPLLDMINHKMGGKGAAKSNLDGSRFTILAGQNYTDGEEVFTSYGDDCNLHYLLTYGFEVEGNALPCRAINASSTWEGKETSLAWHWATSGVGSNSVLPKSGRIQAVQQGSKS